ncbi:MAG: hypothetical protein Q8P44_08030 [Dehalococcoidia bacterium]|nr:hypothetical protein [Dehalococcoidia bacterium]
MHKWDSFLWTADEWFITYSLPPGNLSGVKLFAIGHTVELYLKAANTMLTNDIDRAINFGHNLKAIWDDCKKDSKFMPSFVFRDSVFNRYFLSESEAKCLDKADLLHYLENQEFYIVAKYLSDLKYLGAPLKSVKGAFSFGYVHQHPYWIKFLRELRDYIGHPNETRQDIIAHHLQEGDLPKQSTQYLKELYT